MINQILTYLLPIAGAAVAWKFALYFWEQFQPLEMPVQYAKKWAYNKGVAFGNFYNRKIKNEKFRNKTREDIRNAINDIADSFVAGLDSTK